MQYILRFTFFRTILQVLIGSQETHYLSKMID